MNPADIHAIKDKLVKSIESFPIIDGSFSSINPFLSFDH